MRNVLRMILLMFVFNIIQGESFIEIEYLDRGVYGFNSFMGPFFSDYNLNGNDELIIRQANTINFYEYQENNDYALINELRIDSLNLLWTVGTADLDCDDLKEIVLGYPLNDSIHLRIFEQSDSTSFFNNLVWQSDTLYRSVYFLSISNNLKGDGVDRIFGGGIPWLTTPSKAYGWYYFTCTGDNQYEILNTFEESTQIQSAMDIGDIDNDSLTEVVLESYLKTQIYKYESVSSTDDSFEFTDSIMTYASPLCLLILPDIDKDGTNEVAEMLLNYAGNPTSYKCVIFEGTDTIFNRDFEVETDDMVLNAGDMDYGDVDGDSMNELVICGGRHIEVWESTGNNQFELSWEYTDPTYNTIQSHIKCHDFNKNGYDEIIFSGCGQSAGDECTRIFEDSVAVNGIQGSRVPCAVSHELKIQIQMQNQYIIWNTNTQGTLTVYDISGREMLKEESKTNGEHKTNIRQLKNGIYFIKLKDKDKTIIEKYCKIE